MTDRERALDSIVPGDIFHGESSNGASLICLALEVGETTIEARRVTTQDHISFNRKTGITASGNNWIDSAAPLPPEIHQIMLGLDAKSRYARGLEDMRLSIDEKRALVFVASFYPANPLAEGS